MHPALLIDEILRQIFMNLSRRDASRAVVVCQSWKESALDVIWEEVSDMRQIFDFLSERIVPDTEPSARWEKFKSYARRVKQLTFWAVGWQLKTHEMKSWLDACPIEDQDTPFFPALHILNLQCSCLTSRFLALRCMSPSVRILHIHEIVEPIKEIEPLLQTPKFCPYVTKLYYEAPFHIPPPYFNDVLSRLTHLQQLHISAIPLETMISTISAHPTLVSLKWGWTLYQMPECQGSFLRLEELDGWLHDVWPAVKLLTSLHIQGRRLKRTHFVFRKMDTQGSAPGMGILALLDAVSRQPSLESLYLWFFTEQTNLALLCSFSHLEPLIHCQRLEELSISTREHCWTDLSDAAFGTLMKSLPRLRRLVFIYPTLYDDRPPPLTLRYLANLAASCRNLESIILSLDARQAPMQLGCSSSVEVIAGSPHKHDFNPLPSLTSVGFSHSPVNEDDRLTLANYLRSLSVRNLSVTQDSLPTNRPPGTTAENFIVWGRIAELLQRLYTEPQEGYRPES